MKISKAKCLTGPEATKIMVEREQKPVNRKMNPAGHEESIQPPSGPGEV